MIDRCIVDILENSIEVNRSKRGSNIDVPYTHVLIGAISMTNSNGIIEYYAVRSMVKERVNQNPILLEIDILGKLTSLQAKKIDPDNGWVGKNTVALAYSKVYFSYNIAQFLQDVKGVFTDTFSNDVYSHLSIKITVIKKK